MIHQTKEDVTYLYGRAYRKEKERFIFTGMSGKREPSKTSTIRPSSPFHRRAGEDTEEVKKLLKELVFALKRFKDSSNPEDTAQRKEHDSAGARETPRRAWRTYGTLCSDQDHMTYSSKSWAVPETRSGGSPLSQTLSWWVPPQPPGPLPADVQQSWSIGREQTTHYKEIEGPKNVPGSSLKPPSQFKCQFGRFCAKQDICPNTHDCEPRMCFNKNCQNTKCFHAHERDSFDPSKMLPGFVPPKQQGKGKGGGSAARGDRHQSRDRSPDKDRSDHYRERSPRRKRNISPPRDSSRRDRSHRSSRIQDAPQQYQQASWAIHSQLTQDAALESPPQTTGNTPTTRGRPEPRWRVIARAIATGLGRELCLNSYVKSCGGGHPHQQCAKFDAKGSPCPQFKCDNGCYASYTSTKGCHFSHLN